MTVSDAARSDDPRIFTRYLEQQGQDFLLLDTPGGQQVRVRFTGPFLGREVVWDCTFVTLGREQSAGDDKAGSCYIDIGSAGAQGMPLRVCLDLPRIDMPAIRKMIVMIRNYRRLRPGRHAFGSGRAGAAS